MPGVEIVGVREEAGDVNQPSIGRVQQQSQASIEWAGKIASDAELRQRSIARSTALKKGSRTFHEEHGSGTIVAVDDVAGVTVSFDDGETHTYNLVSQRKLKPLLEEAHQLTSDTLFSLVDTDSSGTLDRPEFAYLHQMIAQSERKRAEEMMEARRAEEEARRGEEQQRRFVRKLIVVLLAAFVLILALFGGVGGVVTWVVSAFKDTSAVGATLAANDGHVMKTSKALVPLPLLAAPVLPREQLEGVDSITVSFLDPIVETEVEVRVNAQVAAVVLYSKVHVKFETLSATVKEVLIKDGEATVTLADGTVADVCESNVQCSALMVDDEANADALVEEAIAALAAAGITNATLWGAEDAEDAEDAEHGRQLARGRGGRRSWCQKTKKKRKPPPPSPSPPPPPPRPPPPPPRPRPPPPSPPCFWMSGRCLKSCTPGYYMETHPSCWPVVNRERCEQCRKFGMETWSAIGYDGCDHC